VAKRMRIDIRLEAASPSERVELLHLIQGELADRMATIRQVMGITWPQFEKLYESRGEVRTMSRDGSVVGYCWIEHRGTELHLHAIFVLPEQRGRGIGSAALNALEAEFHNRVEVIELGVANDNTAARRLYERHGFEVQQVLPELGFTVMRKHLG